MKKGKVGFYLLIALLLGIACNEDSPAPDPQKPPAPTLTYAKQTLTFDDLSSIAGSANKSLISDLILKGVNGDKSGYTIKSIRLVRSNPAGAVNVQTKNGSFYIQVSGIASVIFDLTLKHDAKQDANIKNCEVVIQKGKAVALTFKELKKAYSSGGQISENDILQNVQGAKDGYSLKSIANLSDSNIASISGNSIGIKKVGSFTVSLTLTNPNKAEVTIDNAAFKIEKGVAPNLGFSKITKVYSDSRISASDILAKVSGAKDGYSLKSIANLSDDKVASIDGKSLSVKTAGKFTVSLTLEHANKADVTIDNAAFEIEKADAPSGIKIADMMIGTSKSETADYDDIKAHMSGSYDSYQLKSMQIESKLKVSASITGSKPNLTLKISLNAGEKWGAVKLKITLESPKYKDVSLSTGVFIFPPIIKVTKIDLIRFPEKKPSGSYWDFGYGISKKPDIYMRIYDNGGTLKGYSRYRETDFDSSKLPFSWSWDNNIKIDHEDNVFKLYDYDTSSSSEDMGSVKFGPADMSIIDWFPQKWTFKSKDDKIHIKVYFEYSYL